MTVCGGGRLWWGHALAGWVTAQMWSGFWPCPCSHAAHLHHIKQLIPTFSQHALTRISFCRTHLPSPPTHPPAHSPPPTGEEDALPDWDVLGTGFAFGPAAFAVFGFFMGVIWIDTLASEAVGVVGLLAGLLRVPASVMGLTLMAWGNSLGDFFGNPAMARRGQPTMALTACFAGPLFNMLASLALGFGSYFARKHVSSAEVMLRPEVALGCGFLLLYNAAVAAAGLLNGGKLPERFYVFARGWYGLYFVAACVLGLAAGQGDA